MSKSLISLVVLSISKDLAKDLVNAGSIVKEIAKSIGSGGGGPSHFGTAGFNDIKLYKKAYKNILDYLEKLDV